MGSTPSSYLRHHVIDLHFVTKFNPGALGFMLRVRNRTTTNASYRKLKRPYGVPRPVERIQRLLLHVRVTGFARLLGRGSPSRHLWIVGVPVQLTAGRPRFTALASSASLCN